MRRSIVLLTHLALVGALTSCGSGDQVGIPNPAAIYCEEQGGSVSGTEPMCRLPSGETVDAWEYYRAAHPDPADS